MKTAETTKPPYPQQDGQSNSSASCKIGATVLLKEFGTGAPLLPPLSICLDMFICSSHLTVEAG